MAQCNFKIDVQGPIDELINSAKASIIANGGEFEGDDKSGSYSLPTLLGKISGIYIVESNTITFVIERKPVMVSCKRIESELRKYLHSSSAPISEFTLSDTGSLTLRKPVIFSKAELSEPITIKSSQLVTAVISLYVEDHETFGSNETWRGTKTNSVTLSSVHLPLQFMEFVVKMGGEIRIELILTAQIINPEGDVVVNGDFKLFEGASEDTNDLDGRRNFQILVNKNSQGRYTSRVDNDDEGGDFAIADIVVSNSELLPR